MCKVVRIVEILVVECLCLCRILKKGKSEQTNQPINQSPFVKSIKHVNIESNGYIMVIKKNDGLKKRTRRMGGYEDVRIKQT